MTQPYITIEIPFSDGEVQFIDYYAELNGETRDELLQRIFQEVLTDIRNSMK